MATDNDLEKRPTVEEFYEYLNFWMETSDDFGRRNPYEWADVLKPYFLKEARQLVSGYRYHRFSWC
ncbi:hypothetical protein ASG14_16395 [Pedobacter sp. Leaf194]|nr:hypothetical protein ASG14_16395 [Pedobacter sp. Leaf194]